MLHPKYKTIGLLGGMGPAASVALYAKIVHVAQDRYGATQDTDFPQMVILNLPLEGFDETGVVDAPNVIEQLSDGVRKLEQAGSDFIIIACNTVHLFLENMRAVVSIPILSLPERTAIRAHQGGARRVGLLSSQSTRELGLYQTSCTNIGMDVVMVTDEEQGRLNTIILHVMSGAVTTRDTDSMRSIMHRMVTQEHVDAIILGCTELPLVPVDILFDTPVYDTIAIAAEEAVFYAICGDGP